MKCLIYNICDMSQNTAWACRCVDWKKNKKLKTRNDSHMTCVIYYNRDMTQNIITHTWESCRVFFFGTTRDMTSWRDSKHNMTQNILVTWHNSYNVILVTWLNTLHEQECTRMFWNRMMYNRIYMRVSWRVTWLIEYTGERKKKQNTLRTRIGCVASHTVSGNVLKSNAVNTYKAHDWHVTWLFENTRDMTQNMRYSAHEHDMPLHV